MFSMFKTFELQISLKTGYVPTKKEKMAAVKKSNILDTGSSKAPPRKAKSAQPAASNGEPEARPVSTGLGAPAHHAPAHTPAAPVHAHHASAPEPVPAGPPLPAVSRY